MKASAGANAHAIGDGSNGLWRISGRHLLYVFLVLVRPELYLARLDAVD